MFMIGIFILEKKFFLAHSHIVPDKGGIYTESTIGTVKNLNPLALDSSLFDRDLQHLIFEGLLRYNSLTGKIEDGLGKLTVKNPKTYDVTIKENAQFQDGSKVTVDDVLFTFGSVIQNPNFKNQILSQKFEYVSFQVLDDKTIEFSLPEPNSFFPSLLTTPILPQKYFKKAFIEEITDSNYPFNKNPIGTGPYRLKNLVPNLDGSFRVFLEKNKYYYRGVPKIDQIVFYVYPNMDQLNEEKDSRTIFSNLVPEWESKFEAKLNQQYPQKYEKKEFFLPRFVGVFFNLDSNFGKNIALRKAMNLALDKKEILAKENGWQEMNSFFFFEGVDNPSMPPRYTEAVNLLKNSNFSYNENKKIMQFDGQPVILNMITSIAPPIYSRFAQSMVRRWEDELKIKINLQILSSDEFGKALEKRDYDIVLFGENFAKNFDTFSLWHSSESGKYNLSNLTNKDVDFSIEEIKNTGIRSEITELNKSLNEITPGIPIATPKNVLFVDKKLKNFDETFGGNKLRAHDQRFDGIEQWYFFEKRGWDYPAGQSKFLGFFKWLFGQETKTPTPPAASPSLPDGTKK